MILHIVYLARLREVLTQANEQLNLPDSSITVSALIALLVKRGIIWQQELASGRAFRVAVNHEVVPLTTHLQDGDEVAFFPPVTGG